MTLFEFADFSRRTGHTPRASIAESQRAVFEHIAGPGEWWTGAQRVAFAAEVRKAWSQRNDPPWMRDASSGRDSESAEDAPLPPVAIEVAKRVAADAKRLDRAWCESAVAELGDAAYVELVSLAVCLVAIDAFAEALGTEHEPLPEARSGDPTGRRPDGLGDGGAWVEMTVPWQGPNVARALSLAPGGQMAFFGLVASLYSVSDFATLVWQDRPLARPQVELIASRVSAVNECFY